MKNIILTIFLIMECTLPISAELISTNLSNGDVLNEGVNNYRRRGVTNSLFLPQGKQLIVHGVNRLGAASGQGDASPFLRKVVSTNLSILISAGFIGPSWNGPIVGPMNIEYGLSEAGWVVAEFPRTTVSFLLEKKEDSLGNIFSPSRTSSSFVVVPENANGEVDVLLEQSADMVTWSQCFPGTYNTSTQKRFFRVRALEK